MKTFPALKWLKDSITQRDNSKDVENKLLFPDNRANKTDNGQGSIAPHTDCLRKQPRPH